MDIFFGDEVLRITNAYGLVFSFLYVCMCPWNNIIFKVIYIAHFGFSPLFCFFCFFCVFGCFGCFGCFGVCFRGFWFFSSNIYNYFEYCHQRLTFWTHTHATRWKLGAGDNGRNFLAISKSAMKKWFNTIDIPPIFALY